MKTSSVRQRKKIPDAAFEKLRRLLKIGDVESATVEETELLEALSSPGVHHSCPLCQQVTATYRRPLNAGIAAALVCWWSRWPDFEYHSLNELYASNNFLLKVMRGGDFSKLRYWGFIKERTIHGHLSDTKNSGIYRITEGGRDFVLGEILTSPAVYVYANQYLGYNPEDKLISVEEALGRRFSYKQLIQPEALN